MIKLSPLFALATLVVACGGTSSSSTAEGEIKTTKSYQLRYGCSCVAGPCADDFKSLNVYYFESDPNRVHLKTYFDFKPGHGSEYPEGQVDLEGTLDDESSTAASASFADLASFDALTKKPVAAPPKAAKFVGATARLDRALLTQKRTAILEGSPPKGSPEYLEGSLEVEAGADQLAYRCVLTSRYVE